MPKVSQAAKALSSAQSAYIKSSKGIAESELDIKDIYDTLALDQEQLGRTTFAASLGLTALDALGLDDAIAGQKILQEESAREAYESDDSFIEDYNIDEMNLGESVIGGKESPIPLQGGSAEFESYGDVSKSMKKLTPSLSEVEMSGKASWDEFKETDAYSKYLEGFKATPTKEGLFGKWGATSWFSPKKYGDKEFSYKQARKTGKLFGEGGMFGDQELFDLLEDRMGGSMSFGGYPSLDRVSGGKLTSTFAQQIQNNLGTGSWDEYNKLWKKKGFDKMTGIDYTTFSTRYNPTVKK